MKPHKETIDKITDQWLIKAEQDMKASQALAGSVPPLLYPALPDVCSEIMEAADLTHYGVEVRYPGDMPEPEEQETLEAIKIAEKVRDTIVAAINNTE